MTKPSVNWSEIIKGVDYLCQGSDGRGWLSTSSPFIMLGGRVWSRPKGVWLIPADALVSYIPGTCDWKDSLVERPK